MPANSNSFSSRHNTSANARRQESVQKETESTASTVDPSQGSSSNVQGDNQTGYSYPVGHGYGDAMVAGNSYPAKTRQQQQGTQSKSQAGTTQSYDWGESTELEAQPAQFLPQTLQDNSRARPTSTMEEVSASLSRPSPFAPLDLHRSSTSTTSLIHPRLAQDSRHQFQTPTSSATHMSFQSSDRRQSLACSSSNSPYHASVSPTSRLPPSNPPSPPQMTSFSNGHHILPLLPSISSPPRTRSSPTDCFRPFTSSSHPQMDASSNHLSPSTLSAAAPPAKDHSTIASSSSSYRTNNGTPRAVLLLLDFDLWAKFHKQKNEMIITNPGRCLFPRLRFKAVNLDPEAYYGIRVDFAMVTPESLRFDGEVGDWKPHETLGDSSGGHYSQDSNGPSGGGSNNRHESYLHPDGFKPGSHWMTDTISCTKVKLTNEDEDEDESMSTTTTKKKRSAKPKSSSTNTNSNHNDPSHGDRSTANDINTGFFHVKSFHKYIPRIHLLQRDKDSGAITSSTEFRYKTTEFMAVTHYQNYKVNDLKKLHNPHAKGIGEKLSPPVKIPSESPSSSSTALRSQTKKRSRSERQSSQSDSDGTEDEDHDRDGSGELEMAVDTSTSGTSSSGNKKRVRLSPASKVKAPSVNNARMHMPDGGHNNMYRIDKDNNTLATTSLGRGPSADAKVSEQTSRHHFSQQASSNGESAAIAGVHSWSTANETSWMGLRTRTTASTRAIGRISRSGGHMNDSNQQHNHHHLQQQPMMISDHQNHNTNELSMPGQLSSPSQQLYINRAPTTRMGRLPSHLSGSDRPSILGSPSNTLIPSFDASASASASASADTGDDGDADLLQFNQSTPLISLGALDDDTMPDQTALQVPPSDLECSALAVSETADTLMMDPIPQPPALPWSQQCLLEQSPTNISQDPTPAAATSSSSVATEDVTGASLSLTMQVSGQNSANTFPAASLTSASSSSRPHGYVLSLGSNFSQPFVQSASSMLLAPGSYVDNDGAGMVPGFSLFGTSKPSLIGSNTRSGPSSITSGRSRTDSGMSGNYGYGNGSGSSFHQDPRMMRTTILESRTFMSTSSVMSHMPVAGDNLQAKLDSALRENMQLKAFIRERYGVEAEAEANAVVAMGHLQ